MTDDMHRFHLHGQTGRLDKVLTDLLPENSRSNIQSMIKENRVEVDNTRQKANYKLEGNEIITVSLSEVKPLDVIGEAIPLDICYEDHDLLVVNKPAGMVVHPAKGHQSGTLVNALVYYLKNNLSNQDSHRPGLVHRIDKDTSGLILIAKNDVTHRALSAQLLDKTLGRSYIALVNGQISTPKGIIEVPIARDPKQRTKFTVRPDGKEAVTLFEVKHIFSEATLIEAQLKTGRTHQIRVHFDYIGHPVVGDPIYRQGLSQKNGTLAKDQSGQYLHAYQLNFIHPKTKEELSVTAPLPDKFQRLIDNLIK